jgi:hypothetical protein
MHDKKNCLIHVPAFSGDFDWMQPVMVCITNSQILFLMFDCNSHYFAEAWCNS